MSKLRHKIQSNKRKKDLPLVLNKVDLKDNASPISADNLPVGMWEDAANTKSSNFGTDRPLQGGKCIIFNATVYFNIPANNGDISSVSALDETGAIVSMTATFVTDHYEISGIDGNNYWNIKCWGIGATPTDEQKKSYTLLGSVEADLFTWLKADSESTTTLYKAYTGGVDGSIQNYYEGFWGEQNEYSWLDEVGYSKKSNLFLYSEELNNSYWAQATGFGNIATVTPNAIISPDGSSTADLINYDPQGTQSRRVALIDLAAGKEYTASVYVKKNTLSEANIANVTSPFPSLIYNFDTDVISVGGSGIYNEGRDILSDGWVRIYATFEGAPNQDYIGTLSSIAGSTYYWGFQISKGGELSDYIKTVDNNFNPENIFIPRNESITLPPLKDILGNDLQYIGKAPSRASFVEGNCFKGVTGSYFTITGLLTTDTIEVATGSDLPTCTIDGRLDIANDALVFDITIKRAVVPIAFYPTGYIEDPSDYTLFDTLSENSQYNGILQNGSIGNRGVVNKSNGYYEQFGYSISDGINYYSDQALTQLIPINTKIPALSTDLTKCAAYTTGGVRADLQVQQDGKSFLDSGNKIAINKTPRIVQAEQVNRFWTDVNDDIISVGFTDFNGAEVGDQDFNDISEAHKVRNMRKHHTALTGKQLTTEKTITNN